MRKFLSVLITIIGTATIANAQNVITGEVAPDLKVKQWLMDLQPEEADYTCIVFYHSESPQCRKWLARVKNLAQSTEVKMNVIILTKEKYSEAGVTLTEHLGANTCVAFDDEGRSFRNYGVKFIPFCVICNKQRIALWCGHAGGLTQQTIDKITNIKTNKK